MDISPWKEERSGYVAKALSVLSSRVVDVFNFMT